MKYVERMFKSIKICCCMGMCILVLLGCGSKTKPYIVSSYEVQITEEGLVPNSINVIKGNKVIWRNEDKTAHTIQSGQPKDTSAFFPTMTIMPGEAAEMVFDSVGTYLYFSKEYPQRIQGVILVKAGENVEARDPVSDFTNEDSAQ